MVQREGERLQALQRRMAEIGDRCPDDFRCPLVEGFNNLNSINFERMNADLQGISTCVAELLQRVQSAPVPPPNVQSLFDQLLRIEADSRVAEADLAVSARLAERRLRGINLALNQCRSR